MPAAGHAGAAKLTNNPDTGMNESDSEIERDARQFAAHLVLIALVKTHPDKEALVKALTEASADVSEQIAAETSAPLQGRELVQTTVDAVLSKMVAYARGRIGDS